MFLYLSVIGLLKVSECAFYFRVVRETSRRQNRSEFLNELVNGFDAHLTSLRDSATSCRRDDESLEEFM